MHLSEYRDEFHGSKIYNSLIDESSARNIHLRRNDYTYLDSNDVLIKLLINLAIRLFIDNSECTCANINIMSISINIYYICILHK